MERTCICWNKIHDAELNNALAHRFELVCGRPTQEPFQTAGVFMTRIRRKTRPGFMEPGSPALILVWCLDQSFELSRTGR